MYKLIKDFYGLLQAPWSWYACLRKALESLDFVKFPYEHAVHTRREGKQSLMVGVSVNDLLVNETSIAKILKFKMQMAGEFDMGDLGRLSYYLGIEVEQKKNSIQLKQTAYMKKTLENVGMKDCKTTKYPTKST